MRAAANGSAPSGRVTERRRTRWRHTGWDAAASERRPEAVLERQLSRRRVVRPTLGRGQGAVCSACSAAPPHAPRWLAVTEGLRKGRREFQTPDGAPCAARDPARETSVPGAGPLFVCLLGLYDSVRVCLGARRRAPGTDSFLRLPAGSSSRLVPAPLPCGRADQGRGRGARLSEEVRVRERASRHGGLRCGAGPPGEPRGGRASQECVSGPGGRGGRPSPGLGPPVRRTAISLAGESPPEAGKRAGKGGEQGRAGAGRPPRVPACVGGGGAEGGCGLEEGWREGEAEAGRARAGNPSGCGRRCPPKRRAEP